LSSSLLWSSKGNTLVQLGKYDESIAAYDRAIKLDLETQWRCKGDAEAKFGKDNDSISYHEKAIETNSRYAEAWHGKDMHWTRKDGRSGFGFL
jgi:tetratricopeptide (TPR) repeat protein